MLQAFETERLIIRPLLISDADRLFLLDSNPEVMRYVGVSILTQIEDSVKLIEMIQAQYEKFEIGRYAVVEKESGLLIGWSGIKFIDYLVNDHQNFHELGYRFLPETWGKGYATEAGKAFVDKAFSELKVETLYAYAHSDNQASNHILKKLGFSQNGEFIESEDLCNWYEMKSKA